MLVVLVAVISFVVLVVLPPVFLALVARVFAAPTSPREMPCGPATQHLAAAAR
jgi:hypothetical protein